MGISSSVNLCNNALLRLGEQPIVSFTDGSAAAGICQSYYDPTRKMLLRKFLWNFAKVRTQLAANSVAPAFQYNSAFPLPDDFIRLCFIYQQQSSFTIEGDQLLTNDMAPLNICYISDFQDPTQFDDLFVETLTLHMAIKMGWRLTGTGFNPGTMVKELEEVEGQAMLVNSQDRTPDNLIITDYESNMFTGLGQFMNQGIYGGGNIG